MINLQINPESSVQKKDTTILYSNSYSCSTRASLGILQGIGSFVRCLYSTADFNWFEKRYIVQADSLLEGARGVSLAPSRHQIAPAPTKEDRHHVHIVAPENFPQLQQILQNWIMYCDIHSRVSKYFEYRFSAYREIAASVALILHTGGQFTILVCKNAQHEVLSVGVFSVNFFREDLEVNYLVSSPKNLAHRNCVQFKGGGSAILRAIEDMAQTREMPRIMLWSTQHAQTFYEAHGFVSPQGNQLYVKQVPPTSQRTRTEA